MGKKRNKNGVRLARRDDIKEIQNLGNKFRFIYKKELLDAIVKKLVFVYEKDGKVVGFVLYNFRKNSIDDLIVHPDYRHQGIGTKLFKVSVAILGIHYLEIWATFEPTNSVGFWKKMGFQELPRVRITKKGNKLVRMIWKH